MSYSSEASVHAQNVEREELVILHDPYPYGDELFYMSWKMKRGELLDAALSMLHCHDVNYMTKH